MHIHYAVLLYTFVVRCVPRKTTHRLFVYSVLHHCHSGCLGGHSAHTFLTMVAHPCIAYETNYGYVHKNASSSVECMFVCPPLTLDSLISHFPFTCVQARLGFPFIFFFRTLRSIFLLFAYIFGRISVPWQWRSYACYNIIDDGAGSSTCCAFARSRGWSVGRVGGLSHFESATMNDVIAADGLHATTVPHIVSILHWPPHTVNAIYQTIVNWIKKYLVPRVYTIKII